MSEKCCYHVLYKLGGGTCTTFICIAKEIYQSCSVNTHLIETRISLLFCIPFTISLSCHFINH